MEIFDAALNNYLTKHARQFISTLPTTNKQTQAMSSDGKAQLGLSDVHDVASWAAPIAFPAASSWSTRGYSAHHHVLTRLKLSGSGEVILTDARAKQSSGVAFEYLEDPLIDHWERLFGRSRCTATFGGSMLGKRYAKHVQLRT
jgi:hypothetical protein